MWRRQEWFDAVHVAITFPELGFTSDLMLYEGPMHHGALDFRDVRLIEQGGGSIQLRHCVREAHGHLVAGQTFLHQTRRRRIFHMAPEDPRNNPMPWIQLYTERKWTTARACGLSSGRPR
jgi:hypothetical protein